MRHLKAIELKELLDHCNVRPLLLDVREAWEYEHCHIAGSRLVPLSELTRAVETLEREAPVIVICHHGIRSVNAALYLEQQGFSDVANLEGGVDAWAREVDSEMPTY